MSGAAAPSAPPDACISPATSKNDPFGMTFGDKPIWLPVVPGDPCNAALRLAALELQMPVRGADRARTPLYTTGPDRRSLDHGSADSLFDALSIYALGATVAKTLSLHSGRVWLACALLESKYDDPTIEAMCRWKSPKSVRIYARMQPKDYASILLAAMNASVDPSLVRSIPTLDLDSVIAALRARSELESQRTQRAASPSGPPLAAAATTAAPTSGDAAADDDTDADDEDDDVDEIATVTAAGRLSRKDVSVGKRVAVPFRVDGKETYCPGTVASVSGSRARVAFSDGTWQVNLDRLFELADAEREPDVAS